MRLALGSLVLALLPLLLPADDAAALRSVVDARPEDPLAAGDLAIALLRMDRARHDGGRRHGEILSLFSRAFSLADAAPVPHVQRAVWHAQRGALHMLRGDVTGATADLLLCLEEVEREAQVNSAGLVVHCNELLGQASHAAGDLDASAAAFERCAAAAGAHGQSDARCLLGLATTTLERAGAERASDGQVGELLRRVEGTLARASAAQATGAVVELHFAAFKLHERLGNEEAAWRHLSSGNEENKKLFAPYDPRRGAEGFAKAAQVFQRGFWPTPGVGHPSRVPVFVVGMMRSGSSLVEQILSSHSEVFGMGEDSVFNGLLGDIRDDMLEALPSGGVAELERVLRRRGQQVVDGMLAKSTLGVVRPSDAARAGRQERAPGAAAAIDADGAAHAEGGPGGGRAGAPRPVKHVVDKMLFNFRNIGFIHLLFPEALIIHVVRDPMDTIFSCYKNKFEDAGLQFASDFGHLAQEYAVYRRFMEHWAEVLPGRVLTVRYEQLVEDQEGVSRRLIDALGLPWEDGVLRFHETRRSVMTFSAGQVRQKLYRHSVGAWRKYAAFLEPVREQLVQLLGGAARYDWGEA